MRCFHTQGRYERNKTGNREPKVSAWQKRRKGEQEIFGCLNTRIPEKCQRPKGCPLSWDALEQALAPVDVGQCFYHLSREQLAELLLQ